MLIRMSVTVGSFNNGSISDYGGPTDLLVYTGGNSTRVVVTNNYLYRTDLAHATASIGYYFGGINPSLLFSGNYVFGLVAFADWVTATVTGNTVYSTASPYSQGASGMVSARGNLSGYRWGGNHWYGDPALPQWGYGPAGATPGTAYDYATWLTATGLTKPGRYGRSIPPNRVVVRPNAYEPGRANIIVYNWTQRSTVSVDVSAILKVGDHYVVQNAQDFYGAPTVSGTYEGGPLQLPMAGIPAPTPIRGGVPGPTTGPTFNVFVLIATP